MPVAGNQGGARVPLLPFEQELIHLLGITEEEYRQFAAEAAWKGRIRPAAYAHIPDVRCDPVSIIVSLVIGVALSAASALLAPKPQAPSKGRQGNQRQLSSRNGSDRFGTTSGFDSVNELADYAAPIPIVFARREADIGGVMVSPQLVWSRCFSYGTEQGVKMLMVVGECGDADGIARPDLEGIFLGTLPLNAVWKQNFAFYWKRNTPGGAGRIRAADLAYGTRNSPSSGDLQGSDDIYLCPSRSSTLDTAFSGAFSPSSNATFGCYAPIANGTGYRVNFRLVPLPDGPDQEFAALLTSRLERVKITGDWGNADLRNIRGYGQKGVGREYSRYMGLTSVDGQSFAGVAGDHKRLESVAVGSRATFTITGGVLPEDIYTRREDNEDFKANVDDINNTTINLREQADDQLQLGTTVMIARTVWKVVGRSVAVWGQGTVGSFSPRNTQQIELECIEVFGSGNGPGTQIGYVSQLSVTRGIRTDDLGQGLYTYSNPDIAGLSIGPGFYPLMLVDFAVIRNTRPCDTTEFGLKSQVWNRANGLCNFSSLPTPREMWRADERGDSLQSGVMNTYFKRSSVFTIVLRPSGLNPSTGKEYAWAALGEQFVVQGSAPVDQYNFLRITHPSRQQYDFRFVPKNGADVRNSADTELFWLLDARINTVSMAGARLSGSYSTVYGTFTVNAVGRYTTKGELEFAPELASGGQINNTASYINAPTIIQLSSMYPDLEAGTVQATAVTFQGYLPTTATQGREGALCWELCGIPTTPGQVRTATRRFTLSTTRWIELSFTCTADSYYPSTNPYFPNQLAWRLDTTRIAVVGSSGEMNSNDRLNCVLPISPSNQRNPYGLTSTGVIVMVSQTTGLQAPGGRESSFLYELLGDAEALPIGTVKRATFNLGTGSQSVDVELTGTVSAAPATWVTYWGRAKTWSPTTYVPVEGTTAGNWTVGTTVLHTVTISAANPFYRATPTVGAYFNVSAVGQQVESVGLSSDRIFEENGQITDFSNYIERTTSNESSPEHSIVYVNETVGNDIGAPQYDNLTTCGLALRAGRNFQTMDQVRVWLANGTSVPRLHPSDGGAVGPSNLFPDLVYFLLTDPQAGLGGSFSTALIDKTSFANACRFLRTNKLFFNGALANPQNVREYLSQTAPYFLLNFVIANGRFALEPAIPTTSAGQISLGPVPISAMFTGGNIIEDSFRIDYLDADQRRDFMALVTWRLEHVNNFAEERTVSITWNEAGGSDLPSENFNLTDFCCSEAHAELFAKFSLSVRRRITHTVTFKTTPYGLDLAPGNYIRVSTEASPYHAANNGVVDATGVITSITPMPDAVYPVFYYDRDSGDVQEGSMAVVGGKATSPQFYDTIFTLKYAAASQGVYQVEQLTLDDQGLVEIVAAEHPVDASLVSLIAKDLVSTSTFRKDY